MDKSQEVVQESQLQMEIIDIVIVKEGDQFVLYSNQIPLVVQANSREEGFLSFGSLLMTYANDLIKKSTEKNG